MTDATACFGVRTQEGRWISAGEVQAVAIASLATEFCALKTSADMVAALQASV